MKPYFFLLTLLASSLAACTAPLPNASVPAPRVVGDGVFFHYTPPDKTAFGTAQASDQYFAPLLATLQQRNPEQDAKAAIARGEYYLLGQEFREVVSVPPQFVPPPPRLEIATLWPSGSSTSLITRDCPTKVMEGLREHGIDGRIFSQHYQPVARTYAERWNAVLMPQCFAPLATTWDQPLSTLAGKQLKVLSRIDQLIGTKQCNTTADCRSVGLGYLPCNGSAGEYVTYSTVVTDPQQLEATVAEYNALDKQIGKLSDVVPVARCYTMPPPQLGCVAQQCQVTSHFVPPPAPVAPLPPRY